MLYHEWVTRGWCECGYLWTTPGSPNVICKCGHCSILGNVPSDTVAPVTDEEDFKLAVAADCGVLPSEVTLVHVNGST